MSMHTRAQAAHVKLTRIIKAEDFATVIDPLAQVIDYLTQLIDHSAIRLRQPATWAEARRAI